MRSLKQWQRVAIAVFGVLFLMFLTTAIQGDDWVYWVYPAVALVGIGITLWDAPGRKQKREQEAAERARADEEEMQRAKRLERRERKRREKGN